MKFVIKSRWNGSVLFALQCESFKLCVEAAVKAGANLASAYLADANLASAYLADANLADANLADADLVDANLVGADLAGADLVGANLVGANLASAYLVGANLADANLAGANLASANLASANLADADLVGADLAGADLAGADLVDAKGAAYAIACTRILPDGDLIGWKKCRGDVIVKLRIPADAKRSHAFGRKCRAEFADVLEVIGADFAYTCEHGPHTEYRVGQRVIADGWCDDFTQECAQGIHFWITREEAEAW